MTAGRGITHSERFERARQEGGPLDGIQAWVALPNESEETDPEFTHYGTEQLPSFEEGGASARLIAGQAYGLKSRVKTHSPLFYLHWTLKPGARASLPTEYPERALYIASGAIELAGQRFEQGQMLVLTPGHAATVVAERESTVMALGGESVGPRFIEWNFVSSSQERIEQAKADWRGGRMKLPDFDNEEFIPLPGDPAPPPEPMS
jgi:redox-sensitive bicupin YhaK (pirin superfamily)